MQGDRNLESLHVQLNSNTAQDCRFLQSSGSWPFFGAAQFGTMLGTSLQRGSLRNVKSQLHLLGKDKQASETGVLTTK